MLVRCCKLMLGRSTVYCLLVNRVQFLREQSYFAHHQTVNLTRALLCEVVAGKILRRFDEDNPGPKGLLLLAHVLVAGFEPFQNAPREVLEDNEHAIQWAAQDRGGYERKLTALEVAIISESKLFLGGTACQKVVDGIHRGLIIYTPTSFIDIIPDHYKHKPISLYNPKKERLINQYRMIVPRTRNIIEVVQFIVLLLLYFVVMIKREDCRLTGYEVVFCVYAFGWVLDQVASILEHGWQVYTENLWSFLDVTFSIIFITYFVLRMVGRSTENDETARLALDVLSAGAPILIPRLAFNVMSENMLFVSLRAMMADFTMLTILAVWCFAGFLLGLRWLHGEPAQHRSITISKWMLWIWFGLDGEGIQESPGFHWFLGPVMMITFAFLGNTLFLTILVAMLSNTFSNIVANAAAEIQFRRAVLTFEGVKSDAIFAYMPPFNILALLILLPLKFVTKPRLFHKINVYAVRTLNLPVIVAINIYERHCLWIAPRRKHPILPRRRRWWKFWGVSRFSVHGDIQAVFESDPPQWLIDEVDEADNRKGSLLHDAFCQPDGGHRPSRTGGEGNNREESPKGTGSSNARPRRNDSVAYGSITEHVSDRLEELEDTMKRMEDLLNKLVGDEGGSVKGAADEAPKADALEDD